MRKVWIILYKIFFLSNQSHHIRGNNLKTDFFFLFFIFLSHIPFFFFVSWWLSMQNNLFMKKREIKIFFSKKGIFSNWQQCLLINLFFRVHPTDVIILTWFCHMAGIWKVCGWEGGGGSATTMHRHRKHLVF